jgi:hypothetical protein
MVAAGLADTDRSFRHFLEGNILKRRRTAYDERMRLDLHVHLTRMFDADFMQSRAGRGHRSMLPVFIVGMPRSGSTLVEQILASHPKIAGGGERPDFLRALIDAGVESEAAPFPARVPSLSADELSWLGERYIARLRTAIPVERVNDVERATDKMLENFAIIGLIHLALPLARIIWMRRDPVDTCLSCLTAAFADVPYACDLGELGRYYLSCEKMRRHWGTVLPAGAHMSLTQGLRVSPRPRWCWRQTPTSAAALLPFKPPLPSAQWDAGRVHHIRTLRCTLCSAPSTRSRHIDPDRRIGKTRCA